MGNSFPPWAHPIAVNRSKNFIKLYGAILRLRNILTSFDDFEGNEILTDRDFQDYQSIYIDLYQDFKSDVKADKESIN